jgi:hypothetical protein
MHNFITILIADWLYCFQVILRKFFLKKIRFERTTVLGTCGTDERDDDILDVDGGLELSARLQEVGEGGQVELVREHLHHAPFIFNWCIAILIYILTEYLPVKTMNKHNIIFANILGQPWVLYSREIFTIWYSNKGRMTTIGQKNKVSVGHKARYLYFVRLKI